MKKHLIHPGFLHPRPFKAPVTVVCYTHHYTTSTPRIPPRTLLEKQRKRLERQKQLQEASQLRNSSLQEQQQQQLGSFDDIARLFKTNAFSDEDEDSIQRLQDYENTIRRRYESGEFIHLLKEKFQLDPATERIPTSVLLNEFPKLPQTDIDLVKYSLKSLLSPSSNVEWKNLPIYGQQLLYYTAYGPIGPRVGYPFDKLEQDKVANTTSWTSRIDPLTKGVLVLFIVICAIGIVSEMSSGREQKEEEVEEGGKVEKDRIRTSPN